MSANYDIKWWQCDSLLYIYFSQGAVELKCICNDCDNIEIENPLNMTYCHDRKAMHGISTDDVVI